MSQSVLYVGGIPGHLSEESILAYFKQFSQQAKIKIVRYPRRSSKCDLFGFLTIPKSIMPFIQNEVHHLAGKKLIIEEHLSDEKSILIKNSLKRRRLFVRGIKKGISDQDLYDCFSRAGPLESAYIIKDQLNNKNRSFGYVTFMDEETAFRLAEVGVFTCRGAKLFVHPFLKNPADVRVDDFIESPSGNQEEQNQDTQLESPDATAPPKLESKFQSSTAGKTSNHRLVKEHSKLRESGVPGLSAQPSVPKLMQSTSVGAANNKKSTDISSKTQKKGLPRNHDGIRINHRPLAHQDIQYSNMSSSLADTDSQNTSQQHTFRIKVLKRTETESKPRSGDKSHKLALLSKLGYDLERSSSDRSAYMIDDYDDYLTAAQKPTESSYYLKLGAELPHGVKNVRFNLNIDRQRTERV
jgi:RNA recognition motif. (a.k.a. RRM, RBD, or RNP domain)